MISMPCRVCGELVEVRTATVGRVFCSEKCYNGRTPKQPTIPDPPTSQEQEAADFYASIKREMDELHEKMSS